MTVMYKPVNNSAGHFLIVEHPIPLAKVNICRNDNAFGFVAFRNDLEKELYPFFFKRDVPPLITD